MSYASMPGLLGTVIAEAAQYTPRHFTIVERNGTVAQDLIGFMTFARKNDDIAGTCGLDCRTDSALPVGLDFMWRIETAQAHHGVVHNRQRVFAARIVRCQNDVVTQFGCGH